jgi:hypothetical protein
MIKINEQNKITSNGMKKIIPYILILVVLAGLLGSPTKARAIPVTCVFPTQDNVTPPSQQLEPAACLNAGGKPDMTELYGDTGTGETDFNCGVNPFSTGCLASLSNTIWVLSAKIARLGGQFLDYFVYYSTNSSSYDNEFVSKAWGAVRDVANIFFIIALLYIAIKTVLSLDVSGSKKLISYIIIVALIINFSLFTTKVVIDASNILAKVFYNNITPINSNGEDFKPGDGGEKSISIGLINKFNPQLILKPGEPNYDAITFIFIALLLAAITLYTAYVFFAVALLFVARVVSLWIAMIFSPLAFISYTVPFDVPFGHKEWWDDLSKNAFLAPIFIFFLYIIVLFTDFLKTLAQYSEGADIFQRLMSVVIPFAILMVLLMKAKDLATKYSGKVGAAVVSAGKMIGGVALGVGAGAVALGGRQTLGRVATNLAENQKFKDYAAKSKFAGGALRATRWAGEGSFDARGVKVMGKDLSSTGLKVNTFGKAQVGGFTKTRKEYSEKQEKFATSLSVSDYEKAKRGLSEDEIKLKNDERRENRAKTVEGRKIFMTNRVAAVRIREMAKIKKKKLQEAAMALADEGSGGGTAEKPGTPPPGPSPEAPHN